MKLSIARPGFCRAQITGRWGAEVAIAADSQALRLTGRAACRHRARIGHRDTASGRLAVRTPMVSARITGSRLLLKMTVNHRHGSWLVTRAAAHVTRIVTYVYYYSDLLIYAC